MLLKLSVIYEYQIKVSLVLFYKCVQNLYKNLLKICIIYCIIINYIKTTILNDTKLVY